MAEIIIRNRNNAVVTANPALSMLQLLGQNGFPLPVKCGGRARCGYCKISIHKGLEKASPMNIFEKKFRETHPLPDHVRLACQTYISGSCTISIGQTTED